MKRRNADPVFNKAYTEYAGAYSLAVKKMQTYFPGLVAHFEGLPSAMRPQDIVPASTSVQLTDVFYTLIYGRDLVAATLRYKEIPKARAKAFDKAHRDFNWKKRPVNTAPWFVRHLASAKLLLDTKNWPDKGTAVEETEEGGRVFRVGSFTVHDQAAGDPRPTAQILLRAEELLRATDISKAAEVLYGDVYFVGAIDRKKVVLAQYLPREDVIRLLLTKNIESRELSSLIHELGHRYFRRVLTEHSRIDWNRYDHQLRRVETPKLPKIGEQLPNYANKVAGYETRHGKPVIVVEGGSYLYLDSYVKDLKQRILFRSFPTPYAMTSAEEHFCDTFALYVEGQLPEKFIAPFQQVVGVSRAANPRARARLFR